MPGPGATFVIPQRGFSLFEILITVVVISIGLLGLAGLQFAGLKAVNVSQEHTQANLLAQDIEERIRANPAVDYNGINLAWNGGTPSAANCNTTSCTATQMRNFDRREWYFDIRPAAGHNIPFLSKATIAINEVSNDNYVVTITWGGGSSFTSRFSTCTTPPC